MEIRTLVLDHYNSISESTESTTIRIPEDRVFDFQNEFKKTFQKRNKDIESLNEQIKSMDSDIVDIVEKYPDIDPNMRNTIKNENNDSIESISISKLKLLRKRDKVKHISLNKMVSDVMYRLGLSHYKDAILRYNIDQSGDFELTHID